MSVNLLVLYEIREKAQRVNSKRAYKQFEKWVREVVGIYHDKAIERVANMHLFQLREQFAS